MQSTTPTFNLLLKNEGQSTQFNPDIVDTLVCIGITLKQAKYKFSTITPNSHARILARYKDESVEKDSEGLLREVFGWNLAFSPLIGNTPSLSPLVTQLQQQGLLLNTKNEVKSAIRFSTFCDPSTALLFAHSSFPTVESNAIFFGPDTYRFLNYTRKSIKLYFKSHSGAARIVDIGAGSGAGGLFLAKELLRSPSPLLLPHQLEVILTDINPRALYFCKANSLINFIAPPFPQFTLLESNLYDEIKGSVDIIISNPPYMVDDSDSKSVQVHDGESRMYRDGGGSRGIDLSVRIVKEGIKKLNKGVPIVKGDDVFYTEIQKMMNNDVELLEYEEIDVDVWGEELEGKSYSDVERIAVVGLVLQKK